MQHTQARAWPRSNAHNKTLTKVLSLRCFHGSLVRLSLYVCEYLSTRRVVCEYLSHNLFDRKHPEGRGNGWVRVRIFLVQLLCCVGLWVGRFRLFFWEVEIVVATLPSIDSFYQSPKVGVNKLGIFSHHALALWWWLRLKCAITCTPMTIWSFRAGMHSHTTTHTHHALIKTALHPCGF